MGLGDNDMMMELFRSEVESHSEVLSKSLLQLERDASDTSVYDSMMRSAHSIKGAARIVQVEAAVHVSHVMEDCFVAAQRGELQINPSDFDLLLSSLDLLVRIAEATKNAEPQLDRLSGEVHDCVEQLKWLREGRPQSATMSVGTQPTATQSPVTPVATLQPASPVVAPAPPIAQSNIEPAIAPIAQPPKPTSPAEKDPKAPIASSTPAREPARTTKIILLECSTSLLKNNAATLRQTLLRELNADVSEVRFDLSQTIDIDPIGLAFLASAKRYVENHSRASISFTPLSDDMRMVLRVSGIAQS